ncbi:MAG: cupin [Elusimicrobia bacterium CG11_big_fil_rev_8_21_14_0_20_64_6]|nr:MAG: cupin [Elusimicrobia bacterium CG11_big_fil_rev_8_21_14_0_20_64_6]
MSEVLDAADLVAYAKASVVSRALINRDTGSATVFAFDKGESLSEHTAPFDALVHVLDGEAEISVGGVSYRVKAGQMILMPGGTPHALKAVERFKMTLFLARVNPPKKP